MRSPAAVLFDLDGTLLDSAPDLGAALNQLLQTRGRAPVPPAAYRPVASNGANGLLRLGFGDDFNAANKEQLRADFLTAYAANIATQSELFPGVQELLEGLAQAGIATGIVTNKPTYYTNLLLAQFPALQLQSVVCGDTLSMAKPDPAPLIHGARELRVAPEDCWYVGDARRDIDAGRAAGMATLVAAWGYLGPGEDPVSWRADTLLDQPEELLALLRRAAS